MSIPFDSEDLSSIRREARMLVQRAADHEEGIQALLAASETYVRYAEAALANAVDSATGIGYLRSLLRTQLQRSIEEADTARRLRVGAREQHAAALRLLTHLDLGPRCDDGDADNWPRRDAVVVADDYGEVREVVATVLTNAGFVVRTASNGLEALLAAYDMRPAVIVMDVTMPVLDGIEATRLIKATEATRRARVIAYTGNEAVPPRGAETLFAAVLKKPAPPDLVLSTVQHVANL